MSEKRAGRRARLLVAAELRAGGAVSKVMVRNLSASGARLEIRRPPADGTEVELHRGAEVARGRVVWSGEGECGLRFDHPIRMNDWVPSAKSGAGAGHTAATGGNSGTETVGTDEPLGFAPELRNRLADELGLASRMIEGLGDELANDPLVLQRFGRSLQTVDIVMQILGHLANVCRADDTEAAIDAIGMEELRRRLRPKTL